MKAEHARTPDDPRLTAYEAGRWYALEGRQLPAGATMDTRRGYWDEIEETTAPIDMAEAHRILDQACPTWEDFGRLDEILKQNLARIRR